MKEFKILQQKLLKFLKDYLKKSNANGFTIGVSGGLDSAVVASLCAKVARTNALILPTKSSNRQNLEDAKNLCETLGIKYEIIDIEPILQNYKKILKNIDKIRLGNLAARTRMSLLYDNSAKLNTLVVGTSNKSERMLGYGTIWGDLACALNPIGEIYKSDLFAFAKFLNIPPNIINKSPSADLWAGQSDEKELGFSYGEIDLVLKKLEKGAKRSRLIKNFDENLVDMILKRVKNNKFKLSQPPIAKIK